MTDTDQPDRERPRPMATLNGPRRNWESLYKALQKIRMDAGESVGKGGTLHRSTDAIFAKLHETRHDPEMSLTANQASWDFLASLVSGELQLWIISGRVAVAAPPVADPELAAARRRLEAGNV